MKSTRILFALLDHLSFPSSPSYRTTHGKVTLEERLSCLQEELLVFRRAAADKAQRADALEATNRSLTQELENREAAVAAALAEVK